MNTLSSDLLDDSVDGVRLASGSLRDQLAPGGTLLVFLRHLGCLFCREMVDDLRRAATSDAGYPPVLFVVQASPEQAHEFFADRWPEARAVSDPEKRLYRAVGLAQAGIGQALNPSLWACTIRAAAKGHGVGTPVGDPWQMPGLFFVRSDGTVAWQHDFDHAADHPDFERLPDRLPTADVS